MKVVEAKATNETVREKIVPVVNVIQQSFRLDICGRNGGAEMAADECSEGGTAQSEHHFRCHFQFSQM
ncbi:hypothetical protein E3N88_27555 [Mikania micrantha]|uniref:Uncharacterized protein n=1 Tax=Mikania micrantha TaxID=192012 RepID=A0A5N6MYI4_9ASTR|nr:hypothetical protein E3N88_27555 [Mikania micrantha]